MYRNKKSILSITIFLLLTISLTGCRTENNGGKDTTSKNIVGESITSEDGVSENAVTSDNVSENKVSEAADIICYDEYTKKTWIPEGYDGWAAPFTFVITKVKNETIEGKVSIGGFTDLSGEYDMAYGVKKFSGIITNEIAKCQFKDENEINRTLELTFLDDTKMMGTLKPSYEELQKNENYDKSGTYFLRPYNLRDREEYLEYEIFEEKVSISNGDGLEFWREVNIVTGIMNTSHPYPVVYLTNKQGDILYNFYVARINGVDVLDIFIEDFNGDGLNDLKIITGLSNGDDDQDKLELTWIFYQNEDGLFYMDEQETEQMLLEQLE